VRVTLADIAARAGVSQATVSRVLNDKPGVSPATRAAVLEAVDSHGYEGQARLSGRSAGLVGLVLPELDNPVFPAFASSMGASLARHGYNTVLCSQTFGGVHEDDYVRMLLDRGVAGIIFVSGLHANTDAGTGRYTALVERGLPIVLVNGYTPDVDAPFVSNDDAASVDLSVGHLAQLGHRRIGLAIGPRRYVPVVRKTAAFAEALARHLPGDAQVDDPAELVAATHFTVEGGMAAASMLLDRGCTALVCGSDVMALGAARTVRERGLRVPEDVSVVGSDDSLLIAYTDPPLTTVRQPVAAMSAAAVDALLDGITGEPSPRTEYVFRPELVVRGSTAPVPRGRRTHVSLAADAGP
jgi:DNA-binding LacI/PurR family transcriptional regulator